MVTCVLCSLIVVVTVRRTSQQHQVSDRALLVQQVLALEAGGGMFAAPPVTGHGTLEGTAWAVMLQRLLGRDSLKPSVGRVADLAAEEPRGPWRDLYLSVIASVARPGPALDDVGSVTLRLSPVSGDQIRVADDALSLWAEAQANGLVRQLPAAVLGARNWARAALRGCRVNAFVAAHLTEVLAMLRRPGEAQEGGPRCAPPVVPRVIRRPSDEQELLTLVGLALTMRRGAGRDDASSARLRSALAPSVDMTYDSWWAYHAARGYVAAGGSPRDFDPIMDGLVRTADGDGLVPTATQAATTLETTYLAVAVLTAAGASVPAGTRHDVSALPRVAGRRWSDADWAQWGLLLHDLAVAPSAGDRVRVVRAAGRCAAHQPTPATARAIGTCRTAVRRYGSDPPASVDWSRWRGSPSSAWISAAASLGVSPPRDDLRRAVADVGSNLGAAPTSVLAELPAVAGRAHLELDRGLLARIRREVAARRAPSPFQGLFTEVRGDRAATYFPTLAVLRMENRDR